MNTSNIINFGIIDKDKLDDDHDHIYVPSGYETIEETENKRKLYINNITLSFQESLNYNSNISIAKLINFQQFPSNVNNDVILSLIKDNDSNEFEFEFTNISICMNEVLSFQIKLSISSF